MPNFALQKGFVRDMMLRIERNTLEAAAALPVRPSSPSPEWEMENLEIEGVVQFTSYSCFFFLLILVF